MGFAAHNSGGQVRLGLSATVASAVLYSAVVLLGLGPASPSAQGREAGRNAPVVRVPRDPVVSGPGRRLPQVSPGPARHRSPLRPAQEQGQVVVAAAAADEPLGSESSPTPPRTPEAKPKAASAPTSVTQSTAPQTSAPTPNESDPVVTLPELSVTVPEPPVTVTVPALPVQLPRQQLPPLPALPLP